MRHCTRFPREGSPQSTSDRKLLIWLNFFVLRQQVGPCVTLHRAISMTLDGSQFALLYQAVLALGRLGLTFF